MTDWSFTNPADTYGFERVDLDQLTSAIAACEQAQVTIANGLVNQTTLNIRIGADDFSALHRPTELHLGGTARLVMTENNNVVLDVSLALALDRMTPDIAKPWPSDPGQLASLKGSARERAAGLLSVIITQLGHAREFLAPADPEAFRAWPIFSKARLRHALGIAQYAAALHPEPVKAVALPTPWSPAAIFAEDMKQPWPVAKDDRLVSSLQAFGTSVTLSGTTPGAPGAIHVPQLPRADIRLTPTIVHVAAIDPLERLRILRDPAL